ncbi:hypothetical protein NMY22_g2872 [Coprinellus aureogranulatus]|nr:hypothetical protein NMY22_g2872 [Coprinellus aureogranulatus]
MHKRGRCRFAHSSARVRSGTVKLWLAQASVSANPALYRTECVCLRDHSLIATTLGGQRRVMAAAFAARYTGKKAVLARAIPSEFGLDSGPKEFIPTGGHHIPGKHLTPRIHNLAPWPYIAFALIGTISVVVLGYVIYNCYRKTKPRRASGVALQRISLIGRRVTGKHSQNKISSTLLRGGSPDAKSLTSPADPALSDQHLPGENPNSTLQFNALHIRSAHKSFADRDGINTAAWDPQRPNCALSCSSTFSVIRSTGPFSEAVEMTLLSGLVTSLALVALALPTASGKSTDLTPDNFQSSVSNGFWFVEHFSPYCSHCIAFAPTWDKLAKEAETELPHVGLGQVNCVVHGDLCDANKISSYPTLQMYKDGKMIEQFRGARELERIKAFISKHAGKPEPQEEAPPPPAAPPAEKPFKPVLNPTGEVMDLNLASFQQTLERGPTFVKFFAPWCGHCKKLAPTWSVLARQMQGQVQVAAVNCDDEAALCAANKIQGYPTLVYFANGAQSEYKGGRKIDQLKAFATKASEDAVRPLKDDAELAEHLKTEPVVYLLLHSATDPRIIETVKEAAAPLLGSPVVYSTSSKALRSDYNVPQGIHWALLAFKDGDASTVVSAMYGGPAATPDHIKQWLTTHRLPGVVELNQDTFQEVMNAKHNPLVVIAASNEVMSKKIEERVRDIGKKWRARTGGSGEVNGREVIFAWMDTQRWKDWMKSMYGVKMDEDEEDLDDAKVVVTDHKHLIYWNKDRAGSDLKLTSSGQLFAAVEDIAVGKIKYLNSENIVERLARYLNSKMTGLETYITEYPLRFVSWLVAGMLIVFFLIFKLIGNDASKIERGEYVRVNKSNRLD